MRPKSNGAIVWEGSSLLDGSPIVCIVTGFRVKSKNPKTGHMYQAWILRSDISPIEALKTGLDRGICGNCKFRPFVYIAFGVVERKDRRCYVNILGPQSVYRAYKSGRYPLMTPESVGVMLQDASLREGAYGDPAAVPVSVWRALTVATRSHTGYTHQWAEPGADAYRPFLMASVDSAEEYARAVELGWRTFRVRRKGEAREAREVTCPASAEAGYRTQCAACSLCGGAEKVARNITIEAHGSGTRAFITLAALQATARAV